MSDPRRLVDDEASTEFERALVRSWDHEQPTNAARQAALVALGLGAGAAVTAAAGSAAAGTAAAGAGAAAGGSIAPKAAGLMFLKWWAVTAVAAGTVAAGTVYVAHERTQPAPVVAQTAAPTSPPVIQTLPVPAQTIAPAPTVNHEPAKSVRPRASQQASLEEEVAALDRVRTTLDSGDSVHAIHLVDDYEARFPHGSFVQEAEVYRIQALLAKGDRSAAEKAGSKFLSAYPKSPHASRVRSLLGTPR